MLSKYRKKLVKNWFDFKVRDILRTPKALVDPSSNFIVLTQLYSPDIKMYLLAAKTFASYIRPKAFYIVDDNLTAKERLLIEEHLQEVNFLPIGNIELGKCPTGGCWERINAIATLNDDSYVVQLDADTLTLQDPHEVRTAINESTGFTLGTSLGDRVVTAKEASEFASTLKSEHVQIMAERALSDYPNSTQVSYIRGCAGFAGFPPQSLTLDGLSNFSEVMASLVGHLKWQEWGSEQFASNFFVANSPNPLPLEFKAYPYIYDNLDIRQSKFIHFVGSHRFKKGVYIRLGQESISRLCNSTP